jgi:hypothetical protein
VPEDLELLLPENHDVTRVDSLDPMQGDEFRSVLAKAEGLPGLAGMLAHNLWTWHRNGSRRIA